MSVKPTEKELQILQILWEKGKATVRRVHEIMHPNEETGYTTTLKLMQIMNEKGLVERSKEGKTHIYKPLVSKDKTQRQVVDRLLDTVFKGSSSKLVMQLLGHGNNSKEELQEIRNLIDKLEEENDNNND